MMGGGSFLCPSIQTIPSEVRATTARLCTRLAIGDASVGALACITAPLSDVAPNVETVATGAARDLGATALNVGVAGARVGDALGVLLVKVAALEADSAANLTTASIPDWEVITSCVFTV